MEIEMEFVSELDESHVFAFINDKTSKNKASTRALYLAYLRSFFDLCVFKGWCRGNPARLVGVRMDMMTHAQKERRPRALFTREEVDLLIKETAPGGKCPDPFFHCAVPISRYTGLRLGDVAQLEWDCFQKKGVMSVWTDKRDRRVELPIAPRALSNAIAAIPYPICSVVPSTVKERIKYCFPDESLTIKNPATRASLSIRFRTILKKLGIKNRTFHDLRSTYITDCVNRGVPLPHISAAVGHSHTDMTNRYIVKPK